MEGCRLAMTSLDCQGRWCSGADLRLWQDEHGPAWIRPLPFAATGVEDSLLRLHQWTPAESDGPRHAAQFVDAS